MRFFLTGGTGFLGSALVRKLDNHGHHLTVLSRQSSLPQAWKNMNVRLIDDIFSLRESDYFDVVINLAGEGIADRPWSPARKAILRASRLATTEELLRALRGLNTPPRLLLSGSATGVYGHSTPGEVDETTAIISQQEDFAQQLCLDWEQAAWQAHSSMRVVLLRSGVVLGPGGMLKRMLPAFRLGLGGRLGDGLQMLSWVHIEDWVGMVMHILQTEQAQGPYNLTAPEPASNRQLTQLLASHLRRPSLLPLPRGLLQLTLGEMSQLLLGSQQVLPTALLALGYEFRYPRLNEAISQLFPQYAPRTPTRQN